MPAQGDQEEIDITVSDRSVSILWYIRLKDLCHAFELDFSAES